MSATTQAKRYRALGDPSRARIIEELRVAAEPPDATELSERVGLHANTVRSHLRVLVEAGLVTARAQRLPGPGRPRLVFVAVPEGEPPTPEPAGYRLLAEILASYLAASGEDSSARAEEAGRAWGHYLVDRRPRSLPEEGGELEPVMSLLDEFGFEPRLEPADHGHTVLMQHCPFGEVADSYRRIVCSVHLGLIQGALSGLGGNLEADELKPFVKPGVCMAHLERVVPAA